jgi:hypothetical protein
LGAWPRAMGERRRVSRIGLRAMVVSFSWQ